MQKIEDMVTEHMEKQETQNKQREKAVRIVAAAYIIAVLVCSVSGGLVALEMLMYLFGSYIEASFGIGLAAYRSLLYVSTCALIIFGIVNRQRRKNKAGFNIL